MEMEKNMKVSAITTCHPFQEDILDRWMYSLWISWWRCWQFALHMSNTKMISLVHAPRSWCSACVYNVFWSSISALVSGNIYFTFIVTRNDNGWIKWKTKFSNNSLQPHTLCTCIHCSYVLDLSWWKGYIVLFLNWPTYGTMWKHIDIN